MKTKKIIFILIAFLYASISANVSAQTVENSDSLAIATTSQDSTSEMQQIDEPTSGLTFIAHSFTNFIKSTGFANINWQTILMIFIAFVLLYLAIVKQFEPLLLLPIAFGMLLTNSPARLFNTDLFAGGHVHWESLSTREACSITSI